MKCFKIPLTIFLTTVAMLLSYNSMAQDAALPDDPDPLNAPIDGGVSLLIAAGVAYGAKKAHAHRKKQETKNL